MNPSEIVTTVWLPLPPAFRRAILDSAATAFAGRTALQTSFGETVRIGDVHQYISRAEGPLVSTFRKLDQIDRPDAAELILIFFPRLMPYYIGCGTKNPVHHTAYVIEFVTTILIGEGKGSGTDLTIGILAALFHDVAQGLSKRRKITEAHLVDKILQMVNGTATLEQLQEYRNDAVQARQEHMEEGAMIAGRMLSEYQRHHPQALTDDTIQEVQRLIGCHDNPKIPVAYQVVRRTFAENKACQAWQAQLSTREREELENWLTGTGEEYLIGVDDWPLQWLHEADLLWMVTQDGIDADLARFSMAEAKKPSEIVENNVRLHHQEVDLYRDQENLDAYAFLEDTVYRTRTGYALFEYLTQVLNERFPA